MQGFDPFGDPAYADGSQSSIFAYAGQQTDTGGLQYLRARYYQPTVGRFISRDTFPGYFELPQSLNQFTYGLNSPVRYTDPSGNFAFPLSGLNLAASAISLAIRGFGSGGSPCASMDQLLLAGGASALAWITNWTASLATAFLNSYQLGWTNFNTAWSIAQNTPAWSPAWILASSYVALWGGTHVALAAGGAILGYLAADAAIAVVGPAVEAFLTVHQGLAMGISVAGLLVQAGLFAQAVFGGDQNAQLALAGEYDVTGASGLVSGLLSLPPLSFGMGPSNFSFPQFLPGGSAAWENVMLPSIGFGEWAVDLVSAGTSGLTMGSYAMMSNSRRSSAWRPLGVEDLPDSYVPPRGGPRKVTVQDGPYKGRTGWLDADGNIWVPSKPGESHGGPHWDVQINGGKGGHRNVAPK